MAAFNAQAAGKVDCKGCVGSTELKSNGIKSKDIGNRQVKNADLGKNAVTGDKIADGAVEFSKLDPDTQQRITDREAGEPTAFPVSIVTEFAQNATTRISDIKFGDGRTVVGTCAPAELSA